MKTLFSPSDMPRNALFFVCSSHEDRCIGIVGKRGSWCPERSVVFHYDDPNSRRETNHTALCAALGSL